MVVRLVVSFLVSGLALGCTSERNAASCIDDGKCSDPLRPFCDELGVFGEPHACISVSCAPREFISCSGAEALYCDDSGTDFESEACPYGCGESGCNPYLEPRYLPDICDAPASDDEFRVTNTATLDTDLDANCTGGVLAQSAGPSVCVIRYRKIAITGTGTLSVTGDRAVAFVADNEVTIDGVLDISANGTLDGPGGGAAISGGAASLGSGGGGAGFQSMGGHGGTPTVNGGAVNGGGQAPDPALQSALVGGTRSATDSDYPVTSGGAGGASAIIACRGAVNVSGTLDAGGGGGHPGGNIQFACLGGAGGGAGGHIAIQGMVVNVTGQAFANGGGGGAGKPNSATPNEPGEDGRRSTESAAGGFCADGGVGGNGGAEFSPPRNGASGQSPGCGGGGGGSVGYLQTFSPLGAAVEVNPTAASPKFRENQSIPVRTRPKQ